MDMNPINCPSCDSIILLRYSSMPLGHAKSGTKFEATCPFCDTDFEIGYVFDFRKVEPVTSSAETVPHLENPEKEPPGISSGGASYSSGPLNNSENDQRSNAMNPNNASFKSAGDNRSNQMNPNNSAFRSSRGR